jgi:hypothetical protein
MARRFRRAVELGEGVATFSLSRRSERWRQLGRAAARLVALFPCLPRPRRIGVSFSGGGGHGSWSWACLAASRWHGDAQRLASGARVSVSEWDGACPVRVHGVHTRDTSGIRARSGRASSGVGRR